MKIRSVLIMCVLINAWLCWQLSNDVSGLEMFAVHGVFLINWRTYEAEGKAMRALTYPSHLGSQYFFCVVRMEGGMCSISP